MTIIIIGIAVAVLLIAAGGVTIYKRQQMAVQTTTFEGSRTDINIGASDEEEANIGVSAEVDYFKGKQGEAQFHAEMSTAEMLDLVKQGRWDAAWPWVILNIGVLMMVVFLPLLIGTLAGWPESTRCLVAVLFIAGALFAAWPRRNKS